MNRDELAMRIFLQKLESIRPSEVPSEAASREYRLQLFHHAQDSLATADIFMDAKKHYRAMTK